MKSTISRRLATTLAGVAVLAGGFAATSTVDASALPSSCKAWLNTNGGSQQAEGVCSSIGRDTKVQVVMVIPAWPDYTSGWFHDAGRRHSTSWAAKWGSWQARYARTDQARR